MDGIVCDNCSTPLPAGSKYCSTCGTPVPESEAGATQSPNGFPTDLREAVQVATQGEYEIHHELGRGGMGRVFLAREITLDRLVALKVLPPSLMFDESLVERFKREARMVAQLHHPNIISIFRVYQTHNLCFYTMHYVPGRTLGQVMRTSPVLPLPEVERTLTEAADALAYAHKRGVVHRDIKPGNILLDSDRHVHITDFGIAKALSQTTQLTDTGAVIGTPQYMAPEQYEGKEVDGRADQYSLAVVGYQLLVGHCPFESESMKQLLYQHLFTPPRPVNTIRPETPMPLRDAIHKALSKDPDDRFETMEDFKAAIEGKGPPIFVSWIDSPSSERAKRPGRMGREPVSTTQRFSRNLPAVVDEDSQWGVPTVTGVPAYRKALAGLAAAVVVLVAASVFAVSQGDGLGGLLASNGGDADGQRAQTTNSVADQAGMMTLAGNDNPSSPADMTDHGSESEIDSEPGEEEPAPIELDGMGEVTTSTDVQSLASGARPADNGSPSASDAGSEPASSEPVRRQPTPPADTRPSLPANLMAELQTNIDEGKVLHEAGLYFEAVEAYRTVIERAKAMSPLTEYRNGNQLNDLWLQADDGLEKARQACELEKSLGSRTSCP